MLFIGSCSGNFYALDKDTGQTKWVYDIKKDGDQLSFHGDMLFTENMVIVGTDHTIGHVYAFEKETGKVRWKYPAGPGVATKIIRKGEKIYFSTLKDRLVCLNLKNGKQNWSFSTGYSFVKRVNWNFCPVVVGDTVFNGGLDGVVYARNVDSGKLIWKRDLGERVSTSLVISGNYLFVGTKNGHLYKLSQISGTIEKKFKADGTIFGKITLTQNAIVFFVNWSKKGGEILAVDLSLKHVLWRQRAPEGTAWSSAKPFLFQNSLIFGTGAGGIFAFRINDGLKIWSFFLKGEMIRSFGSCGNVLYIGTIKGNLYASKDIDK